MQDCGIRRIFGQSIVLVRKNSDVTWRDSIFSIVFTRCRVHHVLFLTLPSPRIVTLFLAPTTCAIILSFLCSPRLLRVCRLAEQFHHFWRFFLLFLLSRALCYFASGFHRILHICRSGSYRLHNSYSLSFASARSAASSSSSSLSILSSSPFDIYVMHHKFF